MLTAIAAVLTVASVYLSGRKNIWAWPLGLAGAALWVVFGLAIHDIGILVMNVFFVALYIYNFASWKGVTMPSFFGREARIRREMSRLRRNLHDGEEREEAVRRLSEAGFFDKFTFTQTPANMEQADMSSSRLNIVEPSPYVDKQTLEDCKTCGCLLSSERSIPVEVAMYDIGFMIAREGRNLPPYENLVHVLRYDFYCKRDRPSYDRKVYTPQVGGETVIEFFCRVENWAERREQFGALVGPEWRQVTEEGEQYD